MTATITPVGDWQQQVSAPLNRAMGMWIGATKRTASEVTKQAVAWMAQSARSRTPKSQTRRKIERHPDFGDFVAVWRKGREIPVFLGSRKQDPHRYETIKARVLPIRLTGLAKASWGWGMSKLGKGTPTAKFTDRRGVTKAGPVNEGDASGHEITNRLSYLNKIMPIGWEKESALSAGRRMEAAAKRKMEKDMHAIFKRAARATAAAIQ